MSEVTLHAAYIVFGVDVRVILQKRLDRCLVTLRAGVSAQDSGFGVQGLRLTTPRALQGVAVTWVYGRTLWVQGVGLLGFREEGWEWRREGGAGSNQVLAICPAAAF